MKLKFSKKRKINKPRIIITFFLDLKDLEKTTQNYKRYGKIAKDLLELFDGDVDKVKELIEKTYHWTTLHCFNWELETCIKFYVNNYGNKNS